MNEPVDCCGVVPVTMGSLSSTTAETTICGASEAWFTAGSVLERHTHGAAIFGTMLRGSFDTQICGRTLPCVAGTSWVEPCEEPHTNIVGSRGAHVVVFQADTDTMREYESFKPLLESLFVGAVPDVQTHARRVSLELKRQDLLSRLAIESAFVAMLVAAARTQTQVERTRRPPLKVARARDLIHECFRKGVTLNEIARAVDVDPTYLARVFPRYYGASLSSYARNLRFSWTVERVIGSDQSICAVALQGGYADQSHFTRECKARLGLTPGELRRTGKRSAD